MTRPENLFERASYDLNKFRERRIAERRAEQRNCPDRRVHQALTGNPNGPAGGPGSAPGDGGATRS